MAKISAADRRAHCHAYSCVSLYFYERCKNCDEKQCGLHDSMIQVRDATLKLLEKKTVADIAKH